MSPGAGDHVAADRLADPEDLTGGERAHAEACPTCGPRLAGYRELAGGLRAVGAAHRPGDAVRARLWAAIDRDGDARVPTRRRWIAPVAAGLAVAAAIALWLAWPRPPAPPRFEVAVIDTAGAPTRGDARLGDRLRVRARAGAAIAVRIYRNDRELLLECPRQCTREAGALVGATTLDQVARYQIVWLDGAAPPATGSLERDVAAAVAAGAHHEVREIVIE